MRRSRIDSNQTEIVEALRAVGASVLINSDAGNGKPDLTVGYRGQNYLLEVKNRKTSYGRKGLNKLQSQVASTWQGGQIHVVYSVEGALAAIGTEFSKIRS